VINTRDEIYLHIMYILTSLPLYSEPWAGLRITRICFYGNGRFLFIGYS